MSRFIARFFFYSTMATAVWWFVEPVGWWVTNSGAKWLHTLAGYPAPYLLSDIDFRYWFNPLFPPLVGLILASGWLSWRRRGICVFPGIFAFVYLVSLQVAVVYSPYLTNSAVRAYLSSVQVAFNTVVVPVILWLIVTGGPPDGSESVDRDGSSSKKTGVGVPRLMSVWLMMLLFCGVMTVPVVLAGEKTHPDLTLARRELAKSLRSKHFSGTLQAVEKMLRYDPGNRPVGYLGLELRRRHGQNDYVAENAARILGSGQRVRAYRRYVRDHTTGE